MDTKRCSRCKTEKPVSEFDRENRVNGFKAYCRECSKAANRAWYAKNKEQQRARRRRRAETNSVTT